MSADPKPHQVSLILALPPIRPDMDSGGFPLDRAAIIGLADQLRRHAMNLNVAAIKVEVQEKGIAVSIASHKPFSS